MRSRVFFLLAPLLILAVRFAPARAASVMSAGRGFAVHGSDPTRCSVMARDAEALLAQVETLIGMDIPIRPAEPMRLYTVDGEDDQPPRVTIEQRDSGGGFWQALTVYAPLRADPEDVMEGVTQALLNRLARSYRASNGQRRAEAACPSWYAVGVAQNVDPALPRRNRKLWQDAARRGARSPSWADILTWTRMPEGRRLEKAIASLAVDWLLAQAQPDVVTVAVVGPEPLTVDRLAGLAGFDGSAELEAAWHQAMLREAERTEPVWTRSSPLPAEQLQTLLVTCDDTGRVVALDALLERRDEPWVKGAAATVKGRLQRHAVGKPPDMQGIVSNYVFFLEGLTRMRQPGALSRWLGIRPSSGQLRALLDKAQTEHAAWEARRQAEQGFLDAVEATLDREGGVASERARLPNPALRAITGTNQPGGP